jgi:hypothetical protein
LVPIGLKRLGHTRHLGILQAPSAISALQNNFNTMRFNRPVYTDICMMQVIKGSKFQHERLHAHCASCNNVLPRAQTSIFYVKSWRLRRHRFDQRPKGSQRYQYCFLRSDPSSGSSNSKQKKKRKSRRTRLLRFYKHGTYVRLPCDGQVLTHILKSVCDSSLNI